VELILWRHADAGDPDDDPQIDFDRRLTERGRRQAARMARWLQSRLPEQFIVMTSPAPRALETADALGRKLRISERLAPGASGQTLLEEARWLGKRDTRARHIVLVGHQPSLGAAASLALSGVESHWTVRKGAILWLVSRTDEPSRGAYIRAALGPDLV
jgi:phosphohistidine phosphatase